MIKTITALTHEVDDPEVAINEIIEQIDPDTNLLKNSAGLLSCYSEFIDTGVVKALSEKFDFPIVGTTTLATVSGKEFDETALTLMVLTSDDVEFTAGLSDSIVDDSLEPIEKGYKNAMEGYSQKPGLIFAYAPLSQVVGGDFMVGSLDNISGGAPVFGTITVDHNPDYRDAGLLLNGEKYTDKMVMLLCHGEVNPKFIVASISKDKIMRDKDIVTASQGNQLQTVNDMKVIDYLVNLGMKKNDDGTIEGINTIPFVVDYGDGGQPVIRILFALTEEGYAVCGGDIPVGTSLSVGTINHDEVLLTTGKAIDKINSSDDKNGAVIFSCVGRYFALGFDPHAEMTLMTEKFPDNVPYLMTYSGGEICPVYDEDGNLFNRFHNDTFVACIL